jgi:hypothetical protein
MKTTIDKKFDCVKSVRKIREEMARELEGKSEKEILAYYKDKRRSFTLFRKQLENIEPK